MDIESQKERKFAPLIPLFANQKDFAPQQTMANIESHQLMNSGIPGIHFVMHIANSTLNPNSPIFRDKFRKF